MPRRYRARSVATSPSCMATVGTDSASLHRLSQQKRPDHVLNAAVCPRKPAQEAAFIFLSRLVDIVNPMCLELVFFSIRCLLTSAPVAACAVSGG
jgi:hypothetical protein